MGILKLELKPKVKGNFLVAMQKCNCNSEGAFLKQLLTDYSKQKEKQTLFEVDVDDRTGQNYSELRVKSGAKTATEFIKLLLENHKDLKTNE